MTETTRQDPAASAPAPAVPAFDEKALRGWLKKFEFEEAAVLIQVAQVPLRVLDPSVARNRGYFAYPPHSLLYLGAAFKRLGIPHEIIDLNYVVLRAIQDGVEDLEGFWKARLREVVSRYRRPLVCVSFMFDATGEEFEDTCRFIRENFPDACVAAGGVSATADPEAILRKGLADAVFLNEGEQVLERFYAYLRGGAAPPPCNMVFADGAGTVHKTEVVSGGPVDLDIREEYRLIPISEYHKAGSLSNFSRMNGIDVPFSPLLAKRGCRAFCAFCGVRNFNGKGVRLRGYKDVVDEMVLLREEFGIEHFDWLDDDLLNDKKETLKLLEEIARRLPGITWASNNGLIATAVDRAIYDGLRRSGCIGFKVGLESGSPEMLKKVHKPANVKQFLNFAALAQDYLDIFVAVNFILGLPEERFGQILDSLKVAVKSRLHWHNFYIYQHIKNTEFYLAYGGMGDNFNSKEHGRDNEGPAFGFKHGVGRDIKEVSFNPARGGIFKNYRFDPSIPTGYEVFDIDPAKTPPRPWIREIWFTLNTVGNFLSNPCIAGTSEPMLRGMIRWLDVLGKAYPGDALMASLKFFLKHRLGACSGRELEADREAARQRLADSDYWQFRDHQFRFSSFLDLEPPKIPEKLLRTLAEVSVEKESPAS